MTQQCPQRSFILSLQSHRAYSFSSRCGTVCTPAYTCLVAAFGVFLLCRDVPTHVQCMRFIRSAFDHGWDAHTYGCPSTIGPCLARDVTRLLSECELTNHTPLSPYAATAKKLLLSWLPLRPSSEWRRSYASSWYSTKTSPGSCNSVTLAVGSSSHPKLRAEASNGCVRWTSLSLLTGASVLLLPIRRSQANSNAAWCRVLKSLPPAMAASGAVMNSSSLLSAAATADAGCIKLSSCVLH